MTGDDLLHSQSLPEDLILETLLRLPVRSLLQLKCVCKLWKTLISDSEFAKRHLQRLTMDPSITNPQFIIGRGDAKVTSFPVKPLLENPSEPTEAVEFSMEHRFSILGSCNGLVCLLDIDQGYVRLWNPSTRFKSKESPSLGSLFYHWAVTSYGFGYDHVNDKYKVLLDVHSHSLVRSGCSENVILYTFGENSWTSVQNFPFPIPTTSFQGKFVSGTLNWVVVREDGDYSRTTILSFDLGKETYSEILLPQNQKYDSYRDSKPNLGVLHNCLCLSFDIDTHLVLWLMKEYGVAESWTRLMMIPAEHLWKGVDQGPYCVVEPLFIFGNSIVLLKTVDRIFLYNFNSGRIDIPLISTSIGLKQHLHLETLVSPQL
ncbi:F-box/kelch-repeat protein At3g23880-like [Lathyrus oleraceus]|uniref:F-box/kelch-repeat protein At3g23880-like n=1 Tax=Pisum sativum TaxID=3888 RepID=UPI001FC53A82|nr:F-box/kelch-repeat protein At3g23880-like [Pisum sativum]